MNKGIIILGAPASGKSYLEEEIYDHLYNIKYKHEFRVNPDFYVEDEDSEFYNNPLAASSYVYKTIIPEIIELNSNFILQSTGANTKTLRKIIDTPNYQFKAVIVYCNPIIAFIRNFSRDRKLPKQVLLENWLKVYSQMDEYIKLFGEDNIYMYETEYTQEEQEYIDEFEEVNVEDSLNLFGYLNLFDFNTTSSFKKETTIYTPEQEQKRVDKFIKVCNDIEEEFQNYYFHKQNKTYIKEELIKWIT